MSDNKWYSKLITSVREVYSDRIVVSDPDILSEAEEIRAELAAEFVLGRSMGTGYVLHSPCYLPKHRNVEVMA